MRWKSVKRQKADRIAAVERVKFLAEAANKFCWFCGSNWNLFVHEIAAGTASRPKAFSNRITWASACDRCNCQRLTDNGPSGEWPIVRQLAYKLKFDPRHMRLKVDLPAFNELRGRAIGAITSTEVIVAYCREFDGGAA